MRALLIVTCALALGAACGGGPHLERNPTRASASAPVPRPSVVASSSADDDEARVQTRFENAALGCFSGGSWMEAVGSIGEERTLATVRRCRTLLTEALGKKPDDDAGLASVRAIEPAMVDALVAAIEKSGGSGAFVRLYADAAREALAARRAADRARAGKPADEQALGAKEALAKLHASTDKVARVAALVVAADHLESSRGLDSKTKALAASPAFEVVFGVPRHESFSSYARAVAKASGHPVDDGAKELALMKALAAAFADRFEALEKQLPAGEPREAASGYAKRLRAQINEAQ